MRLRYNAPGTSGDRVRNGLGNWTPGEVKPVPDHLEHQARRLVKAGGFTILPDDVPPAGVTVIDEALELDELAAALDALANSESETEPEL